MNSGVLCEEYYFWCGNVVGNNANFFQLECVRMDMLQLRGEDMYIYIMSKRVVRVKMWSLSVGI